MVFQFKTRNNLQLTLKNSFVCFGSSKGDNRKKYCSYHKHVERLKPCERPNLLLVPYAQKKKTAAIQAWMPIDFKY